jgi:hypothetical protein
MEDSIKHRVKHNELVQRLAARMQSEPETAEEWLNGLTETLLESIRHGECVTIKGLGNFYVREERAQWVFKFNPGQQLRAILHWSS